MSGRLRSDEKKTQKVEEKRTPKRDTSKSRAGKSPSRNKSQSRVQKSPKKPKAKTPNKSPSRKSPARKSPSRKSPARKSPSRKSQLLVSPVKKSPSRRSRSRKSSDRWSPSRKSSSRSRKETPVVKSSTPQLEIDSDSSDDTYIPKVRKPLATVRGRTRRSDLEPEIIKDIDNEENTDRSLYSRITRRSIHLPQSHESENIVHLKEIFTSYEQKLSEFSDEDDSLYPQKVIDSIESRPAQREFVTEFGGWFGSLFLIIFLPIYVIALNVMCSEKKCTYQLPNLEPYKKLPTFLNLSAVVGFMIYSILLALLTALPFGGRKVPGFFNKNGKLYYVTNGFFSTVVIHLILIGLEFGKVPIVDVIYDKYLQLSVAAVTLAVLFSVYLYIRSSFVPISTLNPSGDTNSVVYNFFIGREISPRAFDVVDIKMFLLRMLHISGVLLTTVLLCKSLGLNSSEFRESFDLTTLNVNPTMVTLSALLYVCFLDGVLFENTWIASFEVQHEGIGYMSSMLFFGVAFTYGLMPKYVMDYGVELNSWLLAASVVQFLIGYVLFRGSNNQKYSFRRNPYSPALAHLETIPTSQGKKLLVSGYWGFVRHPNYLGDILMHLSFLYYVVPAPPALTCLATVPILVHRSMRDGVRCRQKYEAAWDRYCQRVKYVLVPKIY